MEGFMMKRVRDDLERYEGALGDDFSYDEGYRRKMPGAGCSAGFEGLGAEV